ncbi:MAG: DUF3467 domain-containing protein [Planctomycetes bacterium]|nr:DUF3467 domain-containing protein [Planctomycetota bacterium]
MQARNEGRPHDEEPAAGAPAAGQPREEGVILRMDERAMRTSYANAFRTNATPEEVMLDFGVNLAGPPQRPGGQPEIIFQLGERIILNYYQAKRLALTLGRIIRDHEERFGDIELDVAKRRRPQG